MLRLCLLRMTVYLVLTYFCAPPGVHRRQIRYFRNLIRLSQQPAALSG